MITTDELSEVGSPRLPPLRPLRAVIYLAALLTIATLVTARHVSVHQSAENQGDRTEHAREQLVELDDVSPGLDRFFVEYEGPDTDTIRDRGEGTFLREAADQLLLGGYSRSFLRTDVFQSVSVEVIVATSERVSSTFVSPDGRPADASVVALVDGPPGITVTVVESGPSFSHLQALVIDRFLAARIIVITGGDGAELAGATLLGDVARSQVSTWQQPTGVRENETFIPAGTGTELVWRQVVLMFSVVAFVGGLALVADRGSRRLFLRRLRRMISRRAPSATTPQRVDDISEAVGQQRRRHRGAGLFALVMLLVAVMLPVPAWPYGPVVAFAAAWLHGRAMRWIGLTQSANGVRSPRLRGWRIVPGALSVAVSVLMLAAASTVFFASASAQAIGPGTVDDQLVENLVAITRILGVVLLVMAPVPLILARRLAMPSLSQAIEADTRPHVLYLRAFADDALRMRSRSVGTLSALDRISMRRWERFEEVIARSAGAYGPVRALKEPSTAMPPLGAVRESVDDAVWQQRIGELMETSRLIVVSVARTQHCTVEFQDIAYRGLLHRTVFVIPPVDADERRKRLHVLAAYLGIAPETIDHESADRSVIAVVVHPIRGPIAIVSDAPDDLSYREALRRAVDILEHDDITNGVATSLVLPRALAPIHWGSGPMVWPPRQAPRPRRWFVTTAGAITIVLLVLVVISLTFTSTLAPHPFGVVDTDDSINDVVRDPVSGKVFGLTNQMDIVELALDTPLGQRASGDVIGRFETNVDRFIARDGQMFGVDVGNPRLIATATDAAPGWTTTLPGTPGDIELVGDLIVVTLPDIDSLALYDLGTGDDAGTIEAVGMPWGLEVNRGALLVTSARSGQMLRFDDLPSGERSALTIAIGARSIGTFGDDVWVDTAPEGAITVVDPSTSTIRVEATLRSGNVMGSDGSTALAYVRDREPGDTTTTIAVHQPDGTRCDVILDGPVQSFAVAGDVIVVALRGFTGALTLETCPGE